MLAPNGGQPSLFGVSREGNAGFYALERAAKLERSSTNYELSNAYAARIRSIRGRGRGIQLMRNCGRGRKTRSFPLLKFVARDFEFSGPNFTGFFLLASRLLDSDYTTVLGVHSNLLKPEWIFVTETILKKF